MSESPANASLPSGTATMSDAETVVDATDRLVLPGVVDPTSTSTTCSRSTPTKAPRRAAALGGTTTFIDFAWQAWVGETSLWDEEGTLLEGIERKRDKAENPVVDFGLHAAITREDEAVFEEFEAVIEAGVPTFKLFTAYEFGLDERVHGPDVRRTGRPRRGRRLALRRRRPL